MQCGAEVQGLSGAAKAWPRLRDAAVAQNVAAIYAAPHQFMLLVSLRERGSTNIAESGSVPVAWHRFVLAVLATAIPQNQNEPAPTITPYLHALRGRGFELAQLMEAQGLSSAVCSQLLLEASASQTWTVLPKPAA